jgi:hypothetical protein
MLNEGSSLWNFCIKSPSNRSEPKCNDATSHLFPYGVSGQSRERDTVDWRDQSKSGYRCMKIFNLRFNNLINLGKIKFKKFQFRVFYLAAELLFHWRTHDPDTEIKSLGHKNPLEPHFEATKKILASLPQKII